MTVEPVHFATKYSAGWDLSYLSQDPSAWNNVYMAEYYGLDSLRLERVEAENSKLPPRLTRAGGSFYLLSVIIT